MKNGAGERPIGAGSGQEKIWRAPKSCSTNERPGFPSADQSEGSLRPHRQPLSVPPHPSFLNSWCAPPLMITITFILSTFFLPTHHQPPPHSTQPWPLYGFLSIKTNLTPKLMESTSSPNLLVQKHGSFLTLSKVPALWTTIAWSGQPEVDSKGGFILVQCVPGYRPSTDKCSSVRFWPVP